MNDHYIRDIDSWRQTLETSLRRENSWLALAGLYWLEEGDLSLGSDPESDIHLPSPLVPERLGSLHFSDGETRLDIQSDASVQVDGVTTQKALLQPDVSETPTFVEFGSYRLVVIKRGERYAIRLWDNERPARETFPGRQWYPVRELYRIEAKFQPHPEPVILTLPSATGDAQDLPSVGRVLFTLGDQEFSLEALEGPMEGLFLIFKDLTNGQGSYPGGRYLATSPPDHTQVVLDFNRAYNPPCAFTDFATCALPPAENQIHYAIEAGERFPQSEAPNEA